MDNISNKPGTPYDGAYRNIQMMLVRVLAGPISWDDRTHIMEAMHAVWKHYTSMAEEFRNYKPDGSKPEFSEKWKTR